MKSLVSRIFAGVAVEDLGEGPNGELRLALAGRVGNLHLRAAWVGAGWPADVQQALDRIGPTNARANNFVFVAQQMSPGAVRLLGEHELNWADETGSARILGEGIVVIRDQSQRDRPAPAFSWSPSALAVAEGLLSQDWPEGARTTDLADLVQWSPGQVSNVLGRFDEAGWTVKYGARRGSTAVRELSDRIALLDAWATAIAEQDRHPRIVHRTMRSPLEFLESELAGILDQEVRWAASGWAAAHVLAPMAGAVPSLQIYIHEDDFAHTHDEVEQPLERALRLAGLADAAEGGRVVLYPAHPSVLAMARPGPFGKLVSPARVYADLLAMGGRGEDAAAHLREELLERPMRQRSNRPPEGLRAWERSCRDRLDRLARSKPDLAAAYALGTWSASYRLIDMPKAPGLANFLGALREVKGRETGWPVWLVPDSDAGPHPIDGMAECWFDETVFGDGAHADFWRADPAGRLCLIRGYQEDSPTHPMAGEPGEILDLTLPIWRTGECLLHAARLARRFDAARIQLMMRWSGLAGRRLAAVANRNRFFPPSRPARDSEVVSFVEVSPPEVEDTLAPIVRELVEPLYAAFDFSEPQSLIYEQEIEAMLGREVE